MKILSSIGKTTIVVAALLSAICSSNSKEYPTGFWLILLDNKNQYETGKLAGMARGMMWAQAASKQKIFCPPEELGITDDQYIEIFKTFAKYNSNKLSDPGGGVLVLALKKTFPCKTR